MASPAHPYSKPVKAHDAHHEEEQDMRQYLMYDPKPRGEMNQMVMESMMTTSWKFWVVFAILCCSLQHAFSMPGAT